MVWYSSGEPRTETRKWRHNTGTGDKTLLVSSTDVGALWYLTSSLLSLYPFQICIWSVQNNTVLRHPLKEESFFSAIVRECLKALNCRPLGHITKEWRSRVLFCLFFHLHTLPCPHSLQCSLPARCLWLMGNSEHLVNG